jgi:hypothetical protein
LPPFWGTGDAETEGGGAADPGGASPQSSAAERQRDIAQGADRAVDREGISRPRRRDRAGLEIPSKSLMLRGFINSGFAGQYYDEFLREAGAGIALGRYAEDIFVEGLDKAPEAFIGMLDSRNIRSADF